MKWRLQNRERKRAFLDSHGKLIRDVLKMIELKVHFWEMVSIILCKNQFNLLYHQVVIIHSIVIHLLKVCMAQMFVRLFLQASTVLSWRGNDCETPCTKFRWRGRWKQACLAMEIVFFTKPMYLPKFFLH